MASALVVIVVPDGFATVPVAFTLPNQVFEFAVFHVVMCILTYPRFEQNLNIDPKQVVAIVVAIISGAVTSDVQFWYIAL